LKREGKKCGTPLALVANMTTSDPGMRSIEERTYSFALALVRAYRALPPRDIADRVCWHQLLKSGTSAGANSAESGGSQSRPDWITKRFIALKEMREALLWLRLIRDSATRPVTQVVPLIDEADQLVAILTAVVRTARANQKKRSGK